MTQSRHQSPHPAGWDEARLRAVLTHYETQTPDEAAAEDEAAYDAADQATTHTAMDVPVELVPAVRDLIARRRAS